MKKKVTREIEVDICDGCGKEDGMANACFSCGYCSCWQCSTSLMVKFSYGAHVSGWADGYYCKPCDAKLSESKSDPLHNAYVEVWKLRESEKQWYEDFDRRRKIAEAETERLYNATRRATP